MTDLLLYALPGWGFSAKIFNELSNNGLTIKGLDYFKLSNFTIQSIAEKLSESLSHPSILLAWSFGGLIAIQIAALFPQKVKKLILIASQPRFIADQDWVGINSHSADQFSKNFSHATEAQINYFINLVNYPHRNAHKKTGLAHYFLHQNTAYCEALLNLFFYADLRAEYQSLSAPILHIINQKDAVIMQNEQQLKVLNSNTHFITLADTGHAGFLHYPEIYQEIIKEFCDNEF